MPLFRRKTEEEKQAEAEQRQVAEAARDAQQASLAALEGGGIPLQAQRRLTELREGGAAFFTSDLSVDEFALAREAGLRPLSQVMGSSVYHVGWQSMPGNRSFWRAGSQELHVVSAALNDARRLALGRMEQEARLVGADAVVGVHITRAQYDWGNDLIEFNAVGTAVKLSQSPPAQHPALTNLSVQDFWKLYRGGYRPVGVVGASTVFYVVASWQTQRANSFWGNWANQELQDFTAGLYAARHIAMREIRTQASQLGASGTIGMAIEQEEEEYEVDLGNDNTRTDMIFTFHAIGTAIVEPPGEPQRTATYTALNLKE